MNNVSRRLKYYMERAVEDGRYHVSCANEVKPIVIDFFMRAMTTLNNWDGDIEVCHIIEHVAEAVEYLALQTRKYASLSPKDFEVFTEMVKEFDEILEEVITSNQESREAINKKVICLSEILAKNEFHISDDKDDRETWNSQVFFKLSDLQQVIHRLNTEWNDLCEKGFFALSHFYNFHSGVLYEREKGNNINALDTFMRLLNGEVKIIPVLRHVYKHDGFIFTNIDDHRVVEIIEETY